MTRSSSSHSSLPPAESGITNRLLAALPADDLQRIARTLDIVPLTAKQVLHEPGQVIRHVYFPGGGFCSILRPLRDGNMVEVATVGREGLLGLSAIVDEGRSPAVVLVQSGTGTCYRMPADAFRAEAGECGPFHELLTRYANLQMSVVMQSSACGAVHSIVARLARWLLLACDHIGRNDYAVTQEFAAMMLGVARPTVTVVAGTLQRAGLISYRRGHIVVLDRKGLEAACCECYRVTRDLTWRSAG